MADLANQPAAERACFDLVQSLRARLVETLRPLLAGASRVALVDFPNHPNVGDSAIWLGELCALREAGVTSFCYTSDAGTYSTGRLAERIGDGTILIHGGGNLGDLWAHHQNFRERVIRDFPDNPIIQLAQSIHFNSRERVAQARRIFDEHPRLSLLLRDEPSVAFARNEFRAPCVLCPDMAFGIGPIARPVEPGQECVWLSRVDKESAGESAEGVREAVKVDWLDEPPSSIVWFNTLLTNAGWKTPRLAPKLHPLLRLTFNLMAMERVARGCRMLSRSERVITDRLHGHILCLLMGIPHLLLDERHSKIRHFHETWTSSCGLGRFASDDPSKGRAGARE